MLRCSQFIPPIQTFALNSRFSSHQHNGHFYLTFHVSNLTFPKWKDSLCFPSSLPVCQVIQARSRGVILHSSLHSPISCLSASPVYSFSTVHGFSHFSFRYHHHLPDSPLLSLTLQCSSPLTGLPTSLEFLQTGWEEGRKNNPVLLTIHKKKNNTPTEKWAKATSSSQKRKDERFKACEKCSSSLSRRE